MTGVGDDVIPFGMVQGPKDSLDGLNLVGLKRRGMAREDIAALRAAYDVLRDGQGAMADRARGLAKGSPLVAELAEFILAGSDRHFMTPT